MKRRARPNRRQATLFATPIEASPSMSESTRAIVDVLADLLLEAAGRRNAMEDSDEPEDHT